MSSGGARPTNIDEQGESTNVSQGKFASITSSLLARKGEAAPWAQNGRAPLSGRAEAVAPPPVPAQRMPPPEPPPGALKRCTVRLSHADYERLGLMAVKKDVTRQHLLQSALADVLAGMAREFSQGCSCLGEGKVCNGPCGEDRAR